jgi:peptidoglycan L-alanyl-D-glutamate endopeptidase CwlK
MYKIVKAEHISSVANASYPVVMSGSGTIRTRIMPKFSQTSFNRLSTCHIDLQVIFYEIVRYFDCTILEGHRNEADQEKAFAAGNTKLHYPHGKHNQNPSMAVDVAPWPIPDWSKTSDFAYFGGFVMGIAQRLFDEGKISHKVRYGGDWSINNRLSDESFKDLVHFELI